MGGSVALLVRGGMLGRLGWRPGEIVAPPPCPSFFFVRDAVRRPYFGTFRFAQGRSDTNNLTDSTYAEIKKAWGPRKSGDLVLRGARGWKSRDLGVTR